MALTVYVFQKAKDAARVQAQVMTTAQTVAVCLAHLVVQATVRQLLKTLSLLLDYCTGGNGWYDAASLGPGGTPHEEKNRPRAHTPICPPYSEVRPTSSSSWPRQLLLSSSLSLRAKLDTLGSLPVELALSSYISVPGDLPPQV